MLVSNGGGDQAAGLRRMANSRPVQVIAVSSGKGGVGKTNVSVNLATAMAATGKKVMLMDADLGLANIDVLLGIHPTLNLSHVIEGKCELDEVIFPGPQGMHIIPAASGVKRMAELKESEAAGLIRAFSQLTLPIDVLIVDTAAGISESVTSFCRASQEVIVVVCDEPASITDAYALIKLLNKEYKLFRFHVLANMTHSVQEGRDLFQKLVKVTDRFLDVTLDFMGSVPYDEYLRKAVQKQKAVVEAYPRSKAAGAFKNLVDRADKWPVPTVAGGHLEFFIERLIQASQSAEVATI